MMRSSPPAGYNRYSSTSAHELLGTGNTAYVDTRNVAVGLGRTVVVSNHARDHARTIPKHGLEDGPCGQIGESLSCGRRDSVIPIAVGVECEGRGGLSEVVLLGRVIGQRDTV